MTGLKLWSQPVLRFFNDLNQNIYLLCLVSFKMGFCHLQPKLMHIYSHDDTEEEEEGEAGGGSGGGNGS